MTMMMMCWASDGVQINPRFPYELPSVAALGISNLPYENRVRALMYLQWVHVSPDRLGCNEGGTVR